VHEHQPKAESSFTFFLRNPQFFPKMASYEK